MRVRSASGAQLQIQPGMGGELQVRSRGLGWGRRPGSHPALPRAWEWAQREAGGGSRENRRLGRMRAGERVVRADPLQPVSRSGIVPPVRLAALKDPKPQRRQSLSYRKIKST